MWVFFKKTSVLTNNRETFQINLNTSLSRAFWFCCSVWGRKAGPWVGSQSRRYSAASELPSCLARRHDQFRPRSRAPRAAEATRIPPAPCPRRGPTAAPGGAAEPEPAGPGRLWRLRAVPPPGAKLGRRGVEGGLRNYES